MLEKKEYVVSVDAGGLYIGDSGVFPIESFGADLYRNFFSTPYRRAKTFVKGHGLIIDADDGLYEVSLTEELPDKHPTRMLWSRDDAVILVVKEQLSVCDVLCLSQTQNAAFKATAIEDARMMSVSLPNGWYRARLTGYIRGSEEGEYAQRKLLRKGDEETLRQAQRDYVFGRTSENEFADVRQAVFDEAAFVVFGVCLVVYPLDELPHSYDPDPPEFELCADSHGVADFINSL